MANTHMEIVQPPRHPKMQISFALNWKKIKKGNVIQCWGRHRGTDFQTLLMRMQTVKTQAQGLFSMCQFF